MQFTGHLSKNDPLYNYLVHDILVQVGADGRNGIRVFNSRSSHAVYIYEDRTSNVKVVGKFFAAGKNDFEQAKRKMYREFNNLNEIRSYLGKNHYVARPLGCNENLNCLLVTEFCYGEPLDTVILQSIYNRNEKYLLEKLSALALFLATLHNRSAQPVMVDFQKICRYYNNIVSQLHNICDRCETEYLRNLGEKYRHDPVMYQDQEVLVHGDATPANFFFGQGLYVISFDLERMSRSDRLFDTGRIAGELKHFFLFHTKNKYAAEPFIKHFIWEYSCHFPDREQAFRSITARLPFYMGQTLLRIARNTYLNHQYRRQLIEEAKLTLKRS